MKQWKTHHATMLQIAPNCMKIALTEAETIMKYFTVSVIALVSLQCFTSHPFLPLP